MAGTRPPPRGPSIPQAPAPVALPPAPAPAPAPAPTPVPVATPPLVGHQTEPCDTCGPAYPAARLSGYVPGTAQEVACYILATSPKGSTPLSGTRTTVTDANGVVTQGMYDAYGELMAPGDYVLVTCLPRVETVAPTVLPPLTTVVAKDCAGADVLADTAQTVQTVPHPTAVQLVRICTTASATDREVTLWCNPATGAQVTVVSHWPEGAPPGTPPVVEAYNVDGSVYAGAIGALVKCAGADVEIVSDPVCVNGTQYVRSTFFDATTRTVAGVVWQDALGAVVAAPPGTPVGGLCPTRETVQVDFVKVSPGATLTGAQLLAQVGATRLRAVNLLVESGTATVAGRTTSATFGTNGTFSWAALGADQEDALSTLFSVTANGGAVRLIVSYIL